jgi:GDP-4-dehydro-6-deoxy-D-mannose reductase
MFKIILTGSNGFIGSGLKLKLSNEGYDVISFSRDQGDIEDMDKWNNLPKADIVIHLAARSFVPESWEKPVDYFRVNVMGTLNAINYCKKNGSSLVFISSYLYGNPDRLPVDEEAQVRVNNPYALTKKIAEEICEFYSFHESLNITVIRPFNIYGIGQSENYLISKIINQGLRLNRVEVCDLEPKRDYVYLEDFLDAVLASLKKIKGYQIYNIGSGESHSVKEIIEQVEKILQTNIEVVSTDEKRKAEVDNTIADISKARAILGWYPKTSLEIGLRAILQSKNN